MDKKISTQRVSNIYKQKNGESSQASCAIIGQDFLCGKTIFIVRNHQEEYEHRKFAYELYQDRTSLEQFDFEDLLLILSTAVQEQTIEDLEDCE